MAGSARDRSLQIRLFLNKSHRRVKYLQFQAERQLPGRSQGVNPIAFVQLDSCQCSVEPNDPCGVCDSVCWQQTEEALVGVNLDALPPVPCTFHNFYILYGGFVDSLVPVCQVGLLQEGGETLPTNQHSLDSVL